MEKKQRLVFAFLIFFFLFILPNEAISRIKILSLSESIERAELIVYGRVEKIERSLASEGEVAKPEIAYAIFKIEKIIKEKTEAKTISVIFLDGGWVEDEPKYREGERRLLFLKEVKGGKVHIINDYSLKSGTHYREMVGAGGLFFRKDEPTDEKKIAEYVSAIDEVEKIIKIKNEEEQLKVLITSLDSTNQYVRRNAMEDVRFREKHQKYPSILTGLLQSKDPEVRLLGAETLWKTQKELVIPVLLELLQGKNPPAVRSSAALRLYGINEERVVSALMDANKESEPDIVRESAMRSLSSTAPEQTLPLLLDYLQGTNKRLKHQAIIEISRVYGNNKNNQNILALKPKVVKRLLEIYNQENSWYKISVIESLGWMEAKEVVNFLTNLLTEQDNSIRSTAIEALGKIRDPSALPSLREISLQDEHEYIRNQAKKVIEKIEKNSL